MRYLRTWLPAVLALIVVATMSACGSSSGSGPVSDADVVAAFSGTPVVTEAKVAKVTEGMQQARAFAILGRPSDDVRQADQGSWCYSYPVAGTGIHSTDAYGAGSADADTWYLCFRILSGKLDFKERLKPDELSHH